MSEIYAMTDELRDAIIKCIDFYEPASMKSELSQLRALPTVQQIGRVEIDSEEILDFDVVYAILHKSKQEAENMVYKYRNSWVNKLSRERDRIFSSYKEHFECMSKVLPSVTVEELVQVIKDTPYTRIDDPEFGEIMHRSTSGFSKAILSHLVSRGIVRSE